MALWLMATISELTDLLASGVESSHFSAEALKCIAEAGADDHALICSREQSLPLPPSV